MSGSPKGVGLEFGCCFLSHTCTSVSLVQIVATGVCHTDLYHLFEGMHKDGFPAVLGHEGAGIVESVGPGVTEFQPGRQTFGMAVFSLPHVGKHSEVFEILFLHFQETKSSLCSSPSVNSVAFVKVQKPTSVRKDGGLFRY